MIIWDLSTPSTIFTKKEMNDGSRSGKQSKIVADMRARGVDIGALHGISAKSDELIAAYSRNRVGIVIDPNPQASRDKQSALIGKHSHKRSQ